MATFNFGSSSQQQTKPSFSFGNPQQPTTSGSTGFSFPSTTAPSTTTTTGFGVPTSTGTTGFSFGTGSTTGTSTGPATTSTGFNFGTTQPTTTTTTGFNLSQPTTTGVMGFPTHQPSAMGFNLISQSYNNIDNMVKTIEARYKPSNDNPNCKFLHFFYNVVEEAKQPMTLEAIKRYYARSISPEDMRLAIEKNPDPARMVPVLARSFDDIVKRVEHQKKRIELMNEMLKFLDNKMSEHKRKHEVDVVSQIDDIKQRHADLSHRILKIQSKLEVLTQSGIGIRNEDISLRNKLNTLQRELHKPNQYRGRLNELAPQVNYYLQQSNLLLNTGNVLDDQTKENVKDFLEQQTNGLNHLLSILKKDIKDINYIKQQVSTDKQKNRSINF